MRAQERGGCTKLNRAREAEERALNAAYYSEVSILELASASAALYAWAESNAALDLVSIAEEAAGYI